MVLIEGGLWRSATNLWADLPLPPPASAQGQTVLVTGATGGLGLEAARHLALLGAARVIITTRDAAKGAQAKSSIEASAAAQGNAAVRVEVWSVDLTSFASVREFCALADRQLDRLDHVIENAGVAPVKFDTLLNEEELGKGKGFDECVTVNVLSTFLMALLLLPLLRRTAIRWNAVPSLTVVVSSAHYFTGFPERKAGDILEALRTSRRFHDRYNVTKLLEILMARELASRIDQSPKPRVLVNTVCPSLCYTDLYRHLYWPLSTIASVLGLLVMRKVEVGSRNLVVAALGDENMHGKFIANCVVEEESTLASSDEGRRTGTKVWGELMELLEKAAPGVEENV